MTWRSRCAGRRAYPTNVHLKERHDPHPARRPVLPAHRHPRPAALQLSRIVAGMWRMNEWGMSVEQRVAFIEQCIALGVTSFDHADIYGDYGVEGLFGEALRAQPSLRDRMRAGQQMRHQAGVAAAPAAHDPALRHQRQPHRRVGRGIAAPAAHRPPRPAADPPSRSADGLRRDRRSLRARCARPARCCTSACRISAATSSSRSTAASRWPPTRSNSRRCTWRRCSTKPSTACRTCGVAPMIWSPLAGGRLFSGERRATRRTCGW